MGGLLWALFIGLGGLPYAQLIQILGSGTRTALWLAFAQAVSAVIQTVTGNAPLTLPTAVHHAIKSLTQYGLCAQEFTPTPTAPVDILCNNGALKWDSVNQRIYADGTPEVLTVSGVNLCAPAYYTGEGWYISNSNQVADAASNGTLVFPCKPNTTYSWWHTDGKGGERAFELTTDTVTLGQAATWAVGTPAYNDAMTVRKYTTSADAKLLCILFARVDAEKVGRTKEEQFADFMLVEGDIEEAFAYQPYHEPQTVADIPMLLSVGDITDEKDIISGAVTHCIGCHVFDGTETFSKSSAYGQAFLINAASASWGADRTASVLCTHFLGLPQVKSSQDDNTCFFNQTGHFYFRVTDNSDPDAFKSWLAAEYAAGHPVIVWFVLATETTEQGTPHALHTTDGTNIIDVASNVSPTQLSVEYAAKA